MENPCQLCLPENHRIVVSNIEDGTTFCYSLVLIKGQVITKSSGSCWLQNTNKPNLVVRHADQELPSPVSVCSLKNSSFKILIGLRLGTNNLVLEYCGTVRNIEVSFIPLKTDLHVTPVYIICKGHDGRFQAPTEEDNSVESACKRISIGARLIQCLTAEKLKEAKLERKTFQLAHDLHESNPECVVFHSQLPVEQARQMENEELWEHFGRELMLSTLGSGKCKFLAFLSCTRYCSERSKTKPQTHAEMLSMTEAHVALGGGGLALFGTACLHTWPQHISQVIDRFLDETKVDARFMDDSCYRGTHGGCFATTLGSVCHELGHTFDLGHSVDGIMGRGFDHVDLVFTLRSFSDDTDSCSEDGNRNIISPDNRDLKQHTTIDFTKVLEVTYTMSSPIKRPLKKKDMVMAKEQSSVHSVGNKVNSKNNNNLKVDWEILSDCQEAEDQTFWSESCAAMLSFHRWLNDARELTTSMRFEPHRNVVSSASGVRVVEIRDETGLVVSSWQFLKNKGRETFLLPVGSWCQPPHILVAEDSDGNIIKYPFCHSF